MNTNNDSLLGWFKIVVAWVLMIIGTSNWTAVLTSIALIFTIVFTGLQIYKIWHDIKRQQRLDRFAEKLKDET